MNSDRCDKDKINSDVSRKTSASNKNNRKKAIFIGSILLLCAICIVTILGVKAIKNKRENEIKRQNQIKEYQAIAVELYEEICNSRSDFTIIAGKIAIADDGGDSGFIGRKALLEIALDVCKKEINSEEKRYPRVEELHENMTSISCEEPEIFELSEAIEEYYSAYVERYRIIIEQNYNEYSFSESEKTSASRFRDAMFSAKDILVSQNLISAE